MLIRFLSAYVRSELRGSTRLTAWLTDRLPSLHCAPVRVDNLPAVFMDLRDPTARQWLNASGWGAGERRVMARFVRPGQVVFDIGANLGLHTAYLSQLVGPTGRVFAFEPNLSLTPGLARTCKALGNSQLFTVALSNETGRLPFYIPTDHTMASLGKWQDATETSCEVVRLDSLNLPIPHFIKCDVEGAEFKVFQGAISLLDRTDAPIVMFEVNEHNVAGFTHGITSAIDFLASLSPRYQFFTADEQTGALSRLGRVSYANVVAIPALQGVIADEPC